MEETINYLHQWNADRNVWKFNKVHQIKLLKSVFDREKISKSDFKLSLEYIKSIKGAAKDRLAADAKKLLVAAKFKSTEDTKAPEPVVEEDSKAKLKREKTEKTTRKRAKKILLAVK